MTAPAGDTGPDIHEADYPAVNCRAGMVATVLRERWGLDLAPLFLRLPIAAHDVIAPAERGEIAGIALGSLDDADWSELFDARFTVWHPSSRAEMDDSVREALARHGYVLSVQDGFGNPHSERKYLRRHVRHNALLYGRARDGGYRTADRAYRYVLDSATLWDCMQGESTAFVVVSGAAPNRADPSALLASGLDRLRRAVRSPLTEAEIARLAAVTAEDLADAERWQQTHFFPNGIGRSRALFAQALPHGAPAAGLTGALERSADAWVTVGRFLYKRVTARRAVRAEELSSRVATAHDADAAVAAAVAAFSASGRG